MKKLRKISSLFLVLTTIFCIFTSCASKNQADQDPYTISYNSNGDGTCYVSNIATNPMVTEPYDVVIPEKSPDGDTVTEIRNQGFYSIPKVVTVKYWEYLKKKLPDADLGFYDLAPMADHSHVGMNLNVSAEFLVILQEYYITLDFSEQSPTEETKYIAQRYPELASVAEEIPLLYLDLNFATDIDKISKACTIWNNALETCEEEKNACFVDLKDALEEKDLTLPTEFSNSHDGQYIQSIEIPDSVTNIGKYSFFNCRSLTSITIPGSVTSIGDYAFFDCDNLTNMVIPDSVMSIGDGVFNSCDNLTSITLGKSVMSISDEAFSGCSQLTSITIPDGVTSIGDGAFRDCKSLTSITIPDGVTRIDDEAFSNCNQLTSITIPDGVTHIGEYAFSNCSSLTHITISDDITSIGDYAFSHCNNLTSITIPHNVTSIGTSAFNCCSSLTSITIPDSVTSIGDGAFHGCDALTSVVFENTTGWVASSTKDNVVARLSNEKLKSISMAANYLTKKCSVGYSWERTKEMQEYY